MFREIYNGRTISRREGVRLLESYLARNVDVEEMHLSHTNSTEPHHVQGGNYFAMPCNHIAVAVEDVATVFNHSESEIHMLFVVDKGKDNLLYIFSPSFSGKDPPTMKTYRRRSRCPLPTSTKTHTLLSRAAVDSIRAVSD